jgi:hypothetical protein
MVHWRLEGALSSSIEAVKCETRYIDDMIIIHREIEQKFHVKTQSRKKWSEIQTDAKSARARKYLKLDIKKVN